MIPIWYLSSQVKLDEPSPSKRAGFGGRKSWVKLITRDTDYAIRALIFLAKERTKKRTSATELVKELEIPRPFLRKILQTLTRGKLLASYRGIGGGFVMTKSPDKIFLADLIAIFQGPVTFNECFFRKMICPDMKSCALKKKMRRMERDFVTQLNSINIASLLKQEG